MRRFLIVYGVVALAMISSGFLVLNHKNTSTRRKVARAERKIALLESSHAQNIAQLQKVVADLQREHRAFAMQNRQLQERCKTLEVKNKEAWNQACKALDEINTFLAEQDAEMFQDQLLEMQAKRQRHWEEMRRRRVSCPLGLVIQ